MFVVAVLLSTGLAAGAVLPTGAAGTIPDDRSTVTAERTAQAESISVSITSPPETAKVGAELGFDTPQVGIQVQNTGNTPQTLQSVNFNGGPISDTETISGTIAPGESTTISESFTVDQGTDAGTYSIDVTVDTNGTDGSDGTSLDVERPAVLRVTSTTLENVTAGTTTDFEFTIAEVNEAGSKPQVTHDSATDPSGTTLSYPSVNLQAGGSTTVSAQIDVEESVDGDQTLEWQVAQPGGTGEDDTTISALVLEPAAFTTVQLPDNSLRFDEPKDQVDEIEQRVPVAVTNGGDFNLSVTSLQASFADSRVSATNVELNNSNDPFDGTGTIGPRSTRIVNVTVEAQSILPEKDVTMALSFEGDGVAGRTSSFAEDRTVRIVHETNLQLDQTALNFGKTPPRTVVEKEVTFSETLGYKDLNGLEITQTSGPENGWLTVSKPPDSIAAGESVTVVFELRFSTKAPQLTDFSWTHNVSAEGIPTITVDSSARTKPAGFDDVRAVLDKYESDGDSLGTLSTSMLDIIDQVETGIEDGSVPPTDLGTTLTASSSLSVMIENLDEVDRIEQNESLDRSEAQENVVRAAAAYNTFKVFRGRFNDTQLRASAIEIENTAGTIINETVTAQEEYLGKQPTPTTLREAELKRQRSQLVLLNGNASGATQLDKQADEAFNQYTTQVDTAQQNYRTAQRQRERINQEYAVVAFDQPLILNPLDYPSFVTTQDDVLRSYKRAQAGFETAGATTLATTVEQERAGAKGEFQVARTSMFVALGAYVVIAIALLVHVVTGVFEYRHDTRTTTPDEFLV
jgi:hypothetical protein